MSFITTQEAELNVDGFSALSERDKAQHIKKSDAYLIARNVKPYDNVADVPELLKDASYEIIKGIMSGELYVNKAPELKRKKVKADGVESEKEYQDGAMTITATEQFILDLIKPFTKQSRVQMLRRL
ncbi:hypothetical protein [Acinetobacter gerneri]|jgi:hypothetical protein|uniref:hypothetical protein n=1 Tax=Acinetobacter gerneri TaxID=202952 RepID=UPI0023F3A352|nr:hypothetical protein [Acinetobacter gerneri]MCH4243751.1 hypothetical protein [Acinetobacter gerneri]